MTDNNFKASNLSDKTRRPKISLVCAMAKNRVIGKGNQMPWHLPADLKHFKSVTMSKPILMGRKTFESIGRPLPGRQNVIISHNKDYQADGCDVVHSIDSALELLSENEEIMVIGGGYLYAKMITVADYLYLTFIDLEVEGDTYFPSFESLGFNEINREKYSSDEKNPHNYQFVNFEANNEK